MRFSINSTWILIWFGVIMIAQHDHTVRVTGVALWAAGVVLQFVLSIRHLFFERARNAN
jgi:hypothetical protein